MSMDEPWRAEQARRQAAEEKAWREFEAQATFEESGGFWLSSFKVGQALEAAHHGVSEEYGRPGDDPWTAARREGVEPPARDVGDPQAWWFGDSAA